MIITILLSFVAGVLTVLAPCILPMLPVIVGGSLGGSTKDRRRPYIITASLVVSLIVSTLLIRATTLLIGIDPSVWSYVSGGLIILIGISMLFPTLWVRVASTIGIEHQSQSLLQRAGKDGNSTKSAVLIGAALGPVFNSCSPMYAWVLATILPASPALGFLYLLAYCIGLASTLLLVALLGRKLLNRVRWASDPRGWFQRIIAVIFIFVGMSIITGFDKTVQTYLVEKDPLQLIELERQLVPKN